jgi:hypothetical protein
MAYGTLALALWHKAYSIRHSGTGALAQGTLSVGTWLSGTWRYGSEYGSAWHGSMARHRYVARQGAVSRAYGIRHSGTGALAQSTRSDGSWQSGAWRYGTEYGVAWHGSMARHRYGTAGRRKQGIWHTALWHWRSGTRHSLSGRMALWHLRALWHRVWLGLAR